jgi:alkylated DNA repair protein (DNA oxidative demethylase)
MNISLFENEQGQEEELAPGAVILHGFALPYESAVLSAVDEITTVSPFRHMITPGGFRMSVAMTNCGPLGWVSSEKGYRYDPIDPESGRNWPAMPEVFLELAKSAAERAGFNGFVPDACLINKYSPGAKLSLHQDKDERDSQAPVVSVSLGLPATFLFGGAKRSDKTQRRELQHGDVVVWGGPSRFYYHGVLPLKEGDHPLVGDCRINLTFRKAE